MPKELPPVDVEHPSDLDFMIQTIQSYALDIGRERLRARGRGAAHLEPMLEQAVGRWVYAARTRLIPNVHINGLTLAEYAKDAAAMEPFDEALSAKVNTLSDQVDETTERVVECRKSIPTAFAQAVHRRAEAMGALVNAKEEQRRRRLRKSKPYSRFSALTRGRPLHIDTDAKDRAAATLQSSYDILHHLHTVLPERRQAALDQERLIRRLHKSVP